MLTLLMELDQRYDYDAEPVEGLKISSEYSLSEALISKPDFFLNFKTKTI